MTFGEQATDADMSEKTYELESKLREESPVVPASNTARTSLETAADAETQRENARRTNPNGFSAINTGVDVKAAEEEFATLQRELSGLSHASRRVSRTHSIRKDPIGKETDVENIASSDSATDEDPFDLETTLRGNHTVSTRKVKGIQVR